MSLSKRRHALLMVWIVGCAGSTSCELADSQAPGDKTQICGSAKQIEKGGKKVLSKQQIIMAANRGARRHGHNPAKFDIFYDEENAGWRYLVGRLPPPDMENGQPVPSEREGTFEMNLRSRWPKLRCHDYQAVYYVFRPPAEERGLSIRGRTWVLVDRNTGEVLLVFEEAG